MAERRMFARSMREKHPTWFKMKLERRQLLGELPPENAVNVLLSCLDYLETGSFSGTLSTIENIAASAFLPDLEDAWSKYMQRVENGSAGGAPEGNKNACRGKQPYGSMRHHMGANGTEEEVDSPLGEDTSSAPGKYSYGGTPSKGVPPTRFYRDEATGKIVDREGECS